jgi:GNAT superfamily N-acetyltransferase
VRSSTRPVHVRMAVHGDEGKIARCLYEAFAPHRDAYTVPAFENIVVPGAVIAERIDDMRVFVASDLDDEVVGTLTGEVLDAGGAFLRGFAVRPAWQGSGAAPELLSRVEAALSLRGCRIASLGTTEPLLRAANFYVRHGYQRTGRTSDFFGMRLIEYVKTLPEERQLH